MKYSFVIPVYNRPIETDELLQSLADMTHTECFEVIVIDDGSAQPCQKVVEKYAGRMAVSYHFIENRGPGGARNYGVEQSRGEYIIFLDSDCLVPKDYLTHVEQGIRENETDAFGGPDRAHSNFTNIQKAINYSMTSFLTTGGIRGGKKKMDRFYPRSFNMGVRREVFQRLGGFSAMRFGEDIDLSIRIIRSGYKSRLMEEAWVYHKRRATLSQFFKQVTNSGIARINLLKRHPGSLKPVHLLPAAFTIGTVLCLLAGLFVHAAFLTPLILFAALIGIDSTAKHNSLRVGVLSVAAAYTQLIGYGAGFLTAWLRRCVMRQGTFEAFKNRFYS